MTPKQHNKVLYDEENDVLCVLLANHDVARTRALDDLRLVDYDANDKPLGIEFIGASDGLDLTEAPSAEQIQDLLREAEVDFPILA